MTAEFLHARYANAFRIGFNEHEMMIDFGQVDPEGQTEAIHTRIVIAAGNGALLLKLLNEAVTGYQQAFGDAQGRIAQS